MSETITVDGFVYEIGRFYLADGSPFKLDSYDSKKKVFNVSDSVGHVSRHSVIKEITNLGTIKKAPVELVDGGYYSFNIDLSTNTNEMAHLVGIYNEGYLVVDKSAFCISRATNIIRLIPENESAKQ